MTFLIPLAAGIAIGAAGMAAWTWRDRLTAWVGGASIAEALSDALSDLWDDTTPQPTDTVRRAYGPQLRVVGGDEDGAA